MSTEPRIRRYRSDEDDFFAPSGKPPRVPDGYRWVRTDPLFRLLSAGIYGAALVFSTVYCRLFLHVRIRGAAKLRRVKGGLFLYGNHTQPVGDVFDPALACFPKRIYTVVSPANLALPVIGKLLPYLGALPVADTVQGTKELTKAIGHRLEQGCGIVIYPEAHVWEYYTGIRPFSETAFKFPVKYGAPVYSMTTTYQKRRWGKKPAITLVIDGPFEAGTGSPREQAIRLRDGVYARMKERSGDSTCAYIQYVKEQAAE